MAHRQGVQRLSSRPRSSGASVVAIAASGINDSRSMSGSWGGGLPECNYCRIPKNAAERRCRKFCGTATKTEKRRRKAVVEIFHHRKNEKSPQEDGGENFSPPGGKSWSSPHPSVTSRLLRCREGPGTSCVRAAPGPIVCRAAAVHFQVQECGVRRRESRVPRRPERPTVCIRWACEAGRRGHPVEQR